MAPSAALGMARHDALLRAAHAAGHAFAPVEDTHDEDLAGASRRFLTLSAISLSGFVASCGAFLILA